MCVVCCSVIHLAIAILGSRIPTSGRPALASLICSSESAIDAYLLFGLAEAKALIVRHRAAVLVIANALLIEQTLDAVMIENIIARAPEHARRAAWRIVEKNAADLTACGSNG